MLYVVPEALPETYAWQIRGKAVSDIVWAGTRLDAKGKLRNAPTKNLGDDTLPRHATNHLLVGLTSVSAGVAVLTQPQVSARSFESIRRLLLKYKGIRGIQIDFEYLPPSQAEAFVAYIALLRRELPKQITVHAAVFPPAGMPKAWSNFHDIKKLADAGDGVVVMLYDYHRQGTKPGCVSGMHWLDENAAMLAELPRSKVWLGAPLYGYRFSKKKAVALSHKVFGKIQAEEKTKDGCRVKTTSKGAAYYPARELYERYDALTSKYGFAGIAYWRAGLEPVLSSQRRTEP
jgi:spore germination protein YaaH